MIVLYVCGILAVVSSLLAAVFSDTRRAVFSLWLAGISVGGVFLCFKVELLALTQWISSTLIAIGFLFYERIFREESKSPGVAALIIPTITATCFFGVLWFTLQSVSPSISPEMFEQFELQKRLGEVLSDRHLLSLEVMGLTLLLTVLGMGVLGRPAMEFRAKRQEAGKND